MYSLSPYLWPQCLSFCGVLFNIYDNSRFVGSQVSHVLLFLFCVFLKRCLFFVVCGGLDFLFFVAPSLAVFYSAYAFNSDVSNWNTGAVTRMRQSKCTLSPSLWPRLSLLYILNIRQLELDRITLLTRFVFKCFT